MHTKKGVGRVDDDGDDEDDDDDDDLQEEIEDGKMLLV